MTEIGIAKQVTLEDQACQSRRLCAWGNHAWQNHGFARSGAFCRMGRGI
jgi:hypothetical protein